MKKALCCFSLVGLLAVGNSTATCQSHASKPDRTLTISTENATVKAQEHWTVRVIERNVSHHKINFVYPDPHRYQMSIILNGQPAPTTDLYREVFSPLAPNELATSSGGWKWIRPGRSEETGIPVTMYYDMNTPGRYEIQITLGPGRGPKNVDIKSNTIYITVLPDK